MVLHHDDVGLAVLGNILARLSRVGGVDAHSKPTATDKRMSQTLQFLFHTDSAVSPSHLQYTESNWFTRNLLYEMFH